MAGARSEAAVSRLPPSAFFFFSSRALYGVAIDSDTSATFPRSSCINGSRDF